MLGIFHGTDSLTSRAHEHLATRGQLRIGQHCGDIFETPPDADQAHDIDLIGGDVVQAFADRAKGGSKQTDFGIDQSLQIQRRSTRPHHLGSNHLDDRSTRSNEPQCRRNANGVSRALDDDVLISTKTRLLTMTVTNPPTLTTLEKFHMLAQDPNGSIEPYEDLGCQHGQGIVTNDGDVGLPLDSRLPSRLKGSRNGHREHCRIVIDMIWNWNQGFHWDDHMLCESAISTIAANDPAVMTMSPQPRLAPGTCATGQKWINHDPLTNQFFGSPRAPANTTDDLLSGHAFKGHPTLTDGGIQMREADSIDIDNRLTVCRGEAWPVLKFDESISNNNASIDLGHGASSTCSSSRVASSRS